MTLRCRSARSVAGPPGCVPVRHQPPWNPIALGHGPGPGHLRLRGGGAVERPRRGTLTQVHHLPAPGDRRPRHCARPHLREPPGTRTALGRPGWTFARSASTARTTTWPKRPSPPASRSTPPKPPRPPAPLTAVSAISPGKLTDLSAQARHLIGACYDFDDA